MFVNASIYTYRENLTMWLCKLIIKKLTQLSSHGLCVGMLTFRPQAIRSSDHTESQIKKIDPPVLSLIWPSRQQPISSKVRLPESKWKQISGPSAAAALSRAKSFPPNLSNWKSVSKISDCCYFKPLNFRTVCYAAIYIRKKNLIIMDR